MVSNWDYYFICTVNTLSSSESLFVADPIGWECSHFNPQSMQIAAVVGTAGFITHPLAGTRREYVDLK